MKKKYMDLMTGIFFMVIAVVYTTQIRKIKLTKISLINSAFFPKICVCALILLSVCEIYQGIKSWKVSEDTEEEKKDYRSAALTLGFSLIYVMLLEPLGFLISSVLYMVGFGGHAFRLYRGHHARCGHPEQFHVPYQAGERGGIPSYLLQKVGL